MQDEEGNKRRREKEGIAHLSSFYPVIFNSKSFDQVICRWRLIHLLTQQQNINIVTMSNVQYTMI